MDPLTASLMCVGQKDKMICALQLEVRNKLHSGIQLMSQRDLSNQASWVDKWLRPISTAALSMKKVGYIPVVKMDRFKFGQTPAKLLRL